ASMAFGLEVRPPLLDVELIELAARMPASLRVTRDRDGRYVGKRVLKRVLEREFPHAFVHRRKQGFASPVTPWMTPGRAGRRLLEAMLADPACRLGEFFRIEAIRDLLAAHGPQQNHAGRLWLLLVLGRWLQRHPEVRFDADDAADQPRALAPAA
ncbi:MAG TPA: asparagine synthase-related protein, partial [Phycisphaeraceae bacterium]